MSDTGFMLSGNAVVGLVGGILLADAVKYLRQSPKTIGCADGKALSATDINRLGSVLVWAGVALYLVGFTGIYSLVPSLSAVAGSAIAIALAGLCMKFWSLQRLGRPLAAWRWAGGVLLYPLVSSVGAGFIGYGVVGVLCVGCFVLRYVQVGKYLLLLAPLICYAGLSFWSTYAVVRLDLRNQIMAGKGLETRFDSAYDGMIDNWNWLDLSSQKQVLSLERLNQNILVGKANNYIQSGAKEYANGEIFFNSIMSIIPRILWEDKPIFAGSGNVVSQYTGVRFAEGTAVGIGYIFDFYINFGVLGIMVGYVLLGFLIALLDQIAGDSLGKGRPDRFLYAFVACQPFLNALGFTAEAFPTVLGGVVLSFVILQYAALPLRLIQSTSTPHTVLNQTGSQPNR